jgi:hypothetical protein
MEDSVHVLYLRKYSTDFVEMWYYVYTRCFLAHVTLIHGRSVPPLYPKLISVFLLKSVCYTKKKRLVHNSRYNLAKIYNFIWKDMYV